MANFAFQITGAFQGSGEFAFQGNAGTVAKGVDHGAGHGRKRHPFDLEFPGLPEAVVAPEPIEVAESLRAKDDGAQLALHIIESRREISRIKSQMRLSRNEDALAVMEKEIRAIETHLARVKHESEEDFLLILLM